MAGKKKYQDDDTKRGGDEDDTGEDVKEPNVEEEVDEADDWMDAGDEDEDY